jgi:DNA-binding transcriptional MerR regulator
MSRTDAESGTAARPSLRSIGQVLASLKGEFDDISISKIRFLESVGLISPQRAPSGYRRYTEADVNRLRYILRVQKTQYLPLKVIREHLESMDRGLEPPRLESAPPSSPQPATNGNSASASGPAAPKTAANGNEGTEESASAEPDSAAKPIRLSRSELLAASGLTEPALNELESIQVVTPRRGTSHYGREALAIAVAARRLAVYGMDSRHLRAFKLAADREIGMVEQALAPHVRGGGRNERQHVTAEVTQLVIGVHAALIRIGMER